MCSLFYVTMCLCLRVSIPLKGYAFFCHIFVIIFLLHSAFLDTQRHFTLDFSFIPYSMVVSFYCDHNCPGQMDRSGAVNLSHQPFSPPNIHSLLRLTHRCVNGLGQGHNSLHQQEKGFESLNSYLVTFCHYCSENLS